MTNDVQARSAQDVVRILSSLDRVEGDALRLIYFRGLTHAQAARVLGLTRDGINRCVAHGMRELARRLIHPGTDAEQATHTS